MSSPRSHIRVLQLANAIRDRRDELNLTQPEAVADLGVSLRSLQEWESGRAFPRPLHRRRLERWLTEGRAA